MSQKDLIVVEKLPANIRALYEKSMEKDIVSLGAAAQRLSRIKIGHSNQTFDIPNGDVTKELVCWVVSIGNFMELYDENTPEDEIAIPVCAAIDNFVGSKHGDCHACPNFEWKDRPGSDKKYRECSASWRLAVAVPGAKTPYELKISQTSYNIFKKATAEAKKTYDMPIALLNLKIKLVGKKEGSQEWSIFEFSYEPCAKEPEKINEALVKRLTYQQKYLNYFTEVYGMMNANAAAEGSPKPQPKEAPAEDVKEEITDAEIVDTTPSAEEIAEGSDIQDMDF